MSRIRLLFCVALYIFVFSTIALAQSPDSASLRGTVRSPVGGTVADAEMQLQPKDSGPTQTSHSDARGNYSFSGLRPGVYSLRAAKESLTAEIPALFLSQNESKTADLTLSPNKTGLAAASAESPKFFDEPHFTVSGVTDTTSLGGHGSDTIVRTRETLAKEAASLSKPSPSSAADEASLRKSAEELRGQLAQHESADLQHRLAEIEERLGDPLEAVSHYQRAAEMDPKEAYLFDWGSELLLHHAPEPAIEVFAKGNQLFPHSARMLIGLGAAFFTHGDSATAAGRIVAASDLDPNDPAAYLFLGKMQAAESSTSPEVLERLRRFVTLQPENAEANYYYAVALGKQHRTSEKAAAAEIESLLNKAVRLDPKFALAYLQLGILHSQQDDDSAAIASYKRAIQIDPQLEEAHYRLAQAYRLAGQPDKAQDELRIYERLSKASAQQVERERHEIRQFVYTLRDRPASQKP